MVRELFIVFSDPVMIAAFDAKGVSSPMQGITLALNQLQRQSGYRELQGEALLLKAIAERKISGNILEFIHTVGDRRKGTLFRVFPYEKLDVMKQFGNDRALSKDFDDMRGERIPCRDSVWASDDTAIPWMQVKTYTQSSRTEKYYALVTYAEAGLQRVGNEGPKWLFKLAPGVASFKDVLQEIIVFKIMAPAAVSQSAAA